MSSFIEFDLLSFQSTLICRAREFSWATQAATDIEMTLSHLSDIFLLDGRQPTCLNYATTAAYTLGERFKLNPTVLRGIVWSDIGGVVGTIASSPGSSQCELSSTCKLATRDSVQSGFVEFVETASPKCILFPGMMKLPNEMQLVVIKPMEGDLLTPAETREIGLVFVRAEYLKANELVALQMASKHIFSRRIEGLPGYWTNSVIQAI